MLRAEFEKLSGIYPTPDLYKEIERQYNLFDGDKVEFCKAYKKNKGGLASQIQHLVASQQILDEIRQEARARDFGQLKADYDKLVDELREQKALVAELKEALARAKRLALNVAESMPDFDERGNSNDEERDSCDCK